MGKTIKEEEKKHLKINTLTRCKNNFKNAINVGIMLLSFITS